MKFCAPVVQHIFGLRTPLPLLWRLNFLPPSLAAGLAVRYHPRVVRSPAARAPGVRRWPVCCHHALVRARPVHQPARAAKASLRRLSNSHRMPPATVSQPLHQHQTPSSAHQKPLQGRDSPSCNPMFLFNKKGMLTFFRTSRLH